MPVYVYRCKTCGEVFEKMVRFSEAGHNPLCPKCQSEDTVKKLTAAASFGSTSSAPASSNSSCGSSGRFS